MTADPTLYVSTTDDGHTSDAHTEKGAVGTETTNIKDELEKEGHLLLPIKGVSMMPMLRQNQDCVVVSSCGFDELSLWDVVLYYNPERDAYILHRLLWKGKRKGVNTAVILGDNCITLEYVPEEWILGKLTSFFRGEKEVQLDDPRYQRYVALWVKPWKRRISILKLKGQAWRAASKVKRRVMRKDEKP